MVHRTDIGSMGQASPGNDRMCRRVSSSLLAATMNQKSSLPEVPQLVSQVLTGNSRHQAGTCYQNSIKLSEKSLGV